ncbi:MAG: hypothetical protein H6683_00230 [Deltaproteobacteria bacterium]|nr:hypothetical protein [Deltaproteobacteria bacterium]
MSETIKPAALVVDHDREFGLETAVRLRALGMDADVLTKGAELLDELEARLEAGHLPKLIVVSALLPDRNGLELCKKIKEHRFYNTVHVLVVSNIHRGGKFAADASSRFHADAYMEHPFDLTDLQLKAFELVDDPSLTLPKGVKKKPKPEETIVPDEEQTVAPQPKPVKAAPKEKPAAPPRRGFDAPIQARDEEFSREIKVEDEEVTRIGDLDTTHRMRRPETGEPIERRESEKPRRRRRPDRRVNGDRAAVPRQPSPEPEPDPIDEHVGTGSSADPFAEPGRRRTSRPSFDAVEFPSEGRLSDVLFPELLLSLYRQRAHGTLTLQTFDEERRVAMHDGVPIGIETNYIADLALGSILIEQERMTPAELNLARKQAEEQGRMLGQVLIERNLIDENELNVTLAYQAREKMVSAFRYQEGTYQFIKANGGPATTFKLSDGILHLLLAGIREFYSLALLEDRIYGNKRRVVERTDTRQIRREDLQLSRKEWGLLELINGERTLAEIIANAPLNFIETFQTLYLFFLFGLVRFKDGGGGFFQLDEPVMSRALAEARGMAVAPAPPKPEMLDTPANNNDLIGTLYRLHQASATGVVTVQGRDDTHRILLAGGQPVRIVSDRVSRFNLGNFLVDSGRISPEQRDAALANSEGRGTPLGETLLAEGLIGPHELFEVLTAQAEARLRDLLIRREGRRVRFDSVDERSSGDFPLELNLVKMLLNALLQYEDIEEMEEEIAPLLDQRPLLKPGMQALLRRNMPDSKEAQFIGTINGARKGAQLIEHAAIPRERAVAVLYALDRLHMLDVEV